MMFKVDHISALGLRPIKSDNPVGQPCYELPEYLNLRHEMQKLSRVGQSASIDWTNSIQNAMDLLTNYSKDMQVACYLAYGLLRQYGMHGLSAGLKLLLNMINHFWEDSYPQRRKQAKIESLNWYFLQVQNYLTFVKFSKADEKFHKEAVTTLKKLKEVLINYGIDAEIFLTCSKKIAGMLPTATPLHEPSVEHQPDSEETKTSQVHETVISLEQGLISLTKAARNLMEREPTNAYSYYLNRIAAWSGIANVPFNDKGVTLIAPPDYFNHERLQKVQETGSLREIVATAEELIIQEPFWLDLYFISLNALQKLDEQFSEAYAISERELVHFFSRFAEIEKLKFSDGTPFLSPPYVEQFLLFTARETPSFIADTIAALSEAEQQQIRQVKQLILEKNRHGNPLQWELFNHSFTGKIKLLAYMTVCDTFFHQNEQNLLKPFLFFILEIIERHQLISWDPSRALEALVLVYRCMRLLDNKIKTEQREQVLALIAQIDVKIAMEMVKI